MTIFSRLINAMFEIIDGIKQRRADRLEMNERRKNELIGEARFVAELARKNTARADRAIAEMQAATERAKLFRGDK